MNIPNHSARLCEKYRPYLDAYLDHELPVETQQEIRPHLASCRDCAMIFESRRRIKELVRDAVAREDAPIELVEALRRTFQS